MGLHLSSNRCSMKVFQLSPSAKPNLVGARTTPKLSDRRWQSEDTPAMGTLSHPPALALPPGEDQSHSAQASAP